jgi:hypothetical protein
MGIPKIIHQTWKRKDLPQKFSQRVQQWIQLHPDFEYMFYDDDDLYNLVKQHFPKYLTFYNEMSSMIERVDFARYIMLYVSGGIYADIDTTPLKNIEPLLNTNKIFLDSEPKEHHKDGELISNAIMLSPLTSSSRLFWRSLLDFIVSTYEHHESPVDTTGPKAIKRFFTAFPSFRKSVRIGNSCTLNGLTNKMTDLSLTINNIKLDGVAEACYSRLDEMYVVHLWDNSWVGTKWTDPRWKNKRYWCYALPFLVFAIFVLCFVVDSFFLSPKG